MHAPTYYCHTCWVEMRIIGRIEQLRCPRCLEDMSESRTAVDLRGPVESPMNAEACAS